MSWIGAPSNRFTRFSDNQSVRDQLSIIYFPRIFVFLFQVFDVDNDKVRCRFIEGFDEYKDASQFLPPNPSLGTESGNQRLYHSATRINLAEFAFQR